MVKKRSRSPFFLEDPALGVHVVDLRYIFWDTTLWFKNSLETFFKADFRTDLGQVCKFLGVNLAPEPLKLTSFHGQIDQWSQSWDIPKYVKSQTSQMNHSVEVSFQKLGLLGGEALMQSNSKASIRKSGIKREYNLDQSLSWVNWHKISM